MIPNIISNPAISSRVNRMQNEMQRQGIDEYKLWPSITIPHLPKRSGISRAHKQIVEWAAIEGLEEVCIFEDDIWFPSTDGFRYFINNKPKDFDLYLVGVSRG